MNLALVRWTSLSFVSLLPQKPCSLCTFVILYPLGLSVSLSPLIFWLILALFRISTQMGPANSLAHHAPGTVPLRLRVTCVGLMRNVSALPKPTEIMEIFPPFLNKLPQQCPRVNKISWGQSFGPFVMLLNSTTMGGFSLTTKLQSSFPFWHSELILTKLWLVRNTLTFCCEFGRDVRLLALKFVRIFVRSNLMSPWTSSMIRCNVFTAWETLLQIGLLWIPGTNWRLCWLQNSSRTPGTWDITVSTFSVIQTSLAFVGGAWTQHNNCFSRPGSSVSTWPDLGEVSGLADSSLLLSSWGHREQILALLFFWTGTCHPCSPMGQGVAMASRWGYSARWSLWHQLDRTCLELDVFYW